MLGRSGDECRPRVYLGTFKREGGPQVSLEANLVGLRGARERETASVSMGWGKTRKGTPRGLPRFGQKLVYTYKYLRAMMVPNIGTRRIGESATAHLPVRLDYFQVEVLHLRLDILPVDGHQLFLHKLQRFPTTLLDCMAVDLLGCLAEG